jgi:hypothetical protein
MKRLFLTAFILLFLLVSGFSQAAPQVIETSKAISQESALLWKIMGKDLQEPSYLFGTIHLIGKDDFFIGDSTLAFIRNARKIVFEIDMNEMNNLMTQISLLGKAMMKNGQTLRDLLSADEYTLVNTHFQKMGLPLFLFERMKPMFLSVFAGMDFSPQAITSGDMVSYEMKIMELAEKQKKEISGLETIEFQMSIFDSIPYQDQAKMLVESIRTANSGTNEFDQMVKMYKDQDIEGMVNTLGDDNQLSKYEKLLLVSRNENWIPVMSDIMKKQSSFFAVGAGHLGGEKGVIALLRQHGYTLVPVR